MDVKQENCEIHEHDIKTEAALIYGQTEERLEFPSNIDHDLVIKQAQIFPTSIVKQELENTIKVEEVDISDHEQEVSEFVQFKNESEHCDVPTLSENNDCSDYLTQSCSSTEDISKNCSKEHPCIVCQKNYSSSQAGFNQIDGGPVKKHFCFNQSSDLQQLSDHMTIHYNETPFKCEICFKEFKRKNNLNRHLIIHNNKPLKYDICSREFNQQSLNIHSNEKSNSFKCDICSKDFTFKASLKKHLLIHTKEKPFKCSICSKEFNQQYNLKQHLKIHSNEKSNSLKCDTSVINGFTNANPPNTNEEYFQIVVWHNNGFSVPQIIAMFQQMFQNRPLPTRAVIERIMENLRVHGCFSRRDRRIEPVEAVPRRPLNPDHELRDIMICAAVEQDSTRTTRDLARDFDISHVRVSEILKSNGYRSFKLHRANEKFPNDLYFRMEFCERVMEMANADKHFVRNILFTDELSFSIHGRINQYWSRENQQSTQYPQKLNVWAGILGDNIVGPFFIDGILNAQRYLQLLRNNIIPAVRALDIPFHSIWFQQDECSAHNSILVREYLSELFPGRLIAVFPNMDGHIPWPGRSPDLAPCDFFLRGYIKSKLYGFQEQRARNFDELRIRIHDALKGINPAILYNVRENFYNRLGYCSALGGDRFEHFL